ncbi:hypothetical protein [Chryseobacterium camelliae]|uniref:hypothetical protein n=1 Tax=Chryseobacterium camelliae TaxID=1265445 RepID=UPI001562D437|nr:hypothetical protein [Chryseobacterium camelliae]
MTLMDNTAGKLVCTTKTISMFYPDNESDPDGPGHWESHHVTECKSQQLESCVGEVLPDGTCLGGGGNDPGYPYPGGVGEDPQPEPEDPCDKLKSQTQNQAFKNKVSELDKDGVFSKDNETGFAVAYGSTIKYEALTIANNDALKLPPGNKYFGYIHTHQNKEGAVKIFSPADVFQFLYTCVRNAEEKGTMTDAYGMVITSEGNYMLKYSGDGSYGVGPTQAKKWQAWYDTNYQQLMDDKQFTQHNIEKLFTKFLQEIVNIDGLEVYQLDKATGNTNKLQYDGVNNPVQSIPCPQ